MNTAQSKEKFFNKVTDDILQDFARIVRNPLPREERDLLFEIVSTFGELAEKLWNLKGEIQYQGLAYFGKKVFDLNSSEMKVAQFADMEEHGTGLEGKRIHLVVRPMITAERIPDESEDAVLESRWAKAIVWIPH